MVNLYGEILYNEDLYTSYGYEGTFTNTYAFTYLKGTTVLVKFTPVWTVPEGTSVIVAAGESLSKLQVLQPNVSTPVLFTESPSGTANLYVRVYLYSNIYGLTPIVNSLQFLIMQTSSLYTVATQVLDDGLTASNTTYFIDPWLQNIIIPYSWINQGSHRTALKLIAESCGGVAYQDRVGIVRLESALYENGRLIKDTIGQDRILDARTPVSDVINQVSIQTSPYVALSSQTVWQLQGDNVINNGESKTYRVFFSDYKAVIDASASITSTPSGATITSQQWYTWGGNVTVLGSSDGQTIGITVSGKPLVIRGSRVIVETDSDSTRRNGIRSKLVDNNQLIQDAVIAERIAEAIVDTYANERRDIEADWRGDPTLELGDRVLIDGQEGVIVEQGIKYNGALSGSMKVRRVNG